MIFSTTWKWTIVALHPLSGTFLKDSGKGKSSLGAELWAWHQIVHFAWKEKWPDMWLNTNSWAVVHGLARWSVTWKEHNWKTGDRWVWERGMRIDLSEWVKTLRSLCLMSRPTEGWPQQRKIWIIKWVRWPVLWIPVSFLSHLFSHAMSPQWAHEQSGWGDKNGSYTWTQQLGTSTHQGRPNWISYMAPFPGVISLVAGWLHWTCFHHGRRSICSYWNRYLFWICICLPWMQNFYLNYHLWTYRMLYPCSWL